MEDEEEKALESFILGQYSWERLPPHIKKRLQSSKQVWKEKVLSYSIKHQLRWKNNLIMTMVLDERSYYLEIVRVSRSNLMLYPYHISDVLIKGLRITPFSYYLEMVEDIMTKDFSYDRLPNFTAADCVRLLGIGRNEYIDIMNASRMKGWTNVFRSKKTARKDLLPSSMRPDQEIEHWWRVHIGFVSEEDVKRLTEVEHLTVDLLIDSGSKLAGELDKGAVKSLYLKELLYLDVPIENDDYISVPPLENFVMNRVSGDYFENLLYKIFVSTDERTSVAQLSVILDIPVENVKQAVSMYCRLGFAKKKNVEALVWENEAGAKLASRTRWHISWLMDRSTPPPSTLSFTSRTTTPLSASSMATPNTGLLSDSQASPAFTPNEPATLDIDDSSQHEPSTPLRPLPKPNLPIDPSPSTSPLAIGLSGEQRPSQLKRVGFLFDYTLTALLMMGNLGAGLKSHAVTMYEVGKLAEESMTDFIQELDKVTDSNEGGEAQRYYDSAIATRNTLKFLRHAQARNIPDCDGGIDMLRCERLISLEPATRERILRQNYALLISMAPISPETSVITSCSPIHFGPALPELNSAWFKLFLYDAVGCGPPSVLYPKGARVRILPAMLRESQQLQISEWMHEPVIVSATHLLPTLNATLLESPVLVQQMSHIGYQYEIVEVPFPDGSEDETSEEPIAEHLYDESNLSRHPLVKKIVAALGLGCCFGIIQLLKLTKPSSYHSSQQDSYSACEWGLDGGLVGESVEESIQPMLNKRDPFDEDTVVQWLPFNVSFGLPLHDIALNQRVCQSIIGNNIFSPDNLQKHSKHTRKLSLRLLDFIARHQGSVSLREQPSSSGFVFSFPSASEPAYSSGPTPSSPYSAVSLAPSFSSPSYSGICSLSLVDMPGVLPVPMAILQYGVEGVVN